MWLAKDAFHFAWKKASGDLSLAADIAFLPSVDEERDARRGLRLAPSEPLVQPLAPSRTGISGV